MKNFIKELVGFLKDDVKKDLKTLNDIGEGKIKVGERAKELGKEMINWREVFGKHWMSFIVTALAFACGWYVASIYYQSVCNQFIIENFLNTTFQSANDLLIKDLSINLG